MFASLIFQYPNQEIFESLLEYFDFLFPSSERGYSNESERYFMIPEEAVEQSNRYHEEPLAFVGVASLATRK